MKRLFFALVAIIATTLSLTSCDKERETAIDFSELPASAQATIIEHFDMDDIMLIIYDKELLDKGYSVMFFDGTVVEFNKSGSWESVESSVTGVPTTILLSQIATYLATNYPDALVLEIDKDNNGYDVRLDNLIELEFNLSGVLVGVDMD
ncbi:MAG: PepSY-like domain-containing protein [Rikenellaceae bacterium]